MNWLINLDLNNNMYFFLLSYVILGMGIKYIDAAFDEEICDKKIALIVSPFLGALWAYTMVINEVSATILLAVLLGVLIKGKVDNPGHLMGLLTILGVVVITGINFLLFPLIFLTAAAILDEVGNDFIGYSRKYFLKNKFGHNFLLYFFGRRHLMKIAIFYIAMLSIFPLYFLIAFILFDEGYGIVCMYSDSKKESMKR